MGTRKPPATARWHCRTAPCRSQPARSRKTGKYSAISRNSAVPRSV